MTSFWLELIFHATVESDLGNDFANMSNECELIIHIQNRKIHNIRIKPSLFGMGGGGLLWLENHNQNQTNGKDKEMVTQRKWIVTRHSKYIGPQHRNGSDTHTHAHTHIHFRKSI